MSGELFDGLNQARANRAGAWILLFVGVFGAVFGVWHWRATVVDAFATKQSTFKTLDQIEEDRIAALKTKDTDGDNLSDYDETYVYRTSPYLKDSDGDGIDDKAELAKQTNPNCPEGKDCGPLGGSAGSAANPNVISSADIGANAGALAPVTDSAAQQQAVDSLFNPTPADVRKLLLDSGVAQSEIDKIDDATLMEMYRQSLSDAQKQNPNPAP